MQLESKKLQIQITEKEWEGQKILLEKGGATEKDVNNAENSYINAKLALENGCCNIFLNVSELYVLDPYWGSGFRRVISLIVITGKRHES